MELDARLDALLLALSSFECDRKSRINTNFLEFLPYWNSFDDQAEGELSLYKAQWQRHYDLMTHQEHQIRELLFEKGYDVSMEFLQAVETGFLDGDEDMDSDLLGTVGELTASEEEKSRILADDVIRTRAPIEASSTLDDEEPSWTERVVDVPVSDTILSQLTLKAE